MVSVRPWSKDTQPPVRDRYRALTLEYRTSCAHAIFNQITAKDQVIHPAVRRDHHGAPSLMYSP